MARGHNGDDAREGVGFLGGSGELGEKVVDEAHARVVVQTELLVNTFRCL